MSDFFYRQALAIHSPDENGIVTGRFNISLVGLAWTIALFLAFHLLAWIWIVSGGTVWKGYKETAVTAHKDWSATPFSAPALDTGFEFNLPLFARRGEQLVVNYQHDSDFVAAGGAFPVRVYVHCFLGCTAKDGQSRTVDAAGSGEISVILPRTSLYHVKIIQTSKRDGSTSRGIFWWGTRSPQTIQTSE